MEIVMMIVALVAGALAGFLFAQVKVKDVHAHLLLAQQQAEAERQAKDEVQRQLQESALSLQELQTKLSDTKGSALRSEGSARHGAGAQCQ